MKCSCVRVAFLLVAIAFFAITATQARDLTFEDRVRCQEGIERVYYSHQIGASRSFEEAVPREVLERKVRTYLKQSVALEQFWKTQVTGVVLQHELERIAAHTRLADRLREVYRALDDDPFLIQECFARPILVDRLTRSFLAGDERIQSTARAAAGQLRAQLISGDMDPRLSDSRRRLIEVNQAPSNGLRADLLPDQTVDPVRRPQADRLVLTPEEFETWRLRMRGYPHRIGPLIEERDAFITQVLLAEHPSRIDMAVYAVPKMGWEAWWREHQDDFDSAVAKSVVETSTSLFLPSAVRGSAGSGCLFGDTWDNQSLDGFPEARQFHSAVWTGSLMIVWGGHTGLSSNRGAKYDPVSDTWSAISMTNAPSPRSWHATVWTGSEMIVWGGYQLPPDFFLPIYLNSGGRYDPVSDTWRPISQVGAPSGRNRHTAVWTGTEMIVWGGYDGRSYPFGGGRYDPATDSWRTVSLGGSPIGGEGHIAIWTGNRMIVWGGSVGTSHSQFGGLYDPASDTWSGMSPFGGPSARAYHTAVWTGTEMIVWGGRNSSGGPGLNDGASYKPATNTWHAIPIAGSASGRLRHSAVWTGDKMIVWGGESSDCLSNNCNVLKTGGRYDPLTNTWSPMAGGNAPQERMFHPAIWDGAEMIVWGGADGFNSPLGTGGRYDPLRDAWTPTSTGNGPSPRSGHTAIWTGAQMIVWGSGGTTSGARYDPLSDQWTPTALANAPAVRWGFSSVWTGREMFVWGGMDQTSFFGPALNTGGLYDPLTDTWRSTSLVDVPSPRIGPTVVWTGKDAIVWGGYSGPTGPFYDSGGRYDPDTDSWTPTSLLNAPSARAKHVAIWTGSDMLVWGGTDSPYSFPPMDTGARYNPQTDSWAPTTRFNAPSARINHTAVWNGQLMIVWGGRDVSFNPTNTGGRYDPVADVWMSTTTVGAPVSRMGHTAIWTGDEMVVWGGSVNLDSGGRYDPAADLWLPTSQVEAPMGRESHTAVWTGKEMIVWGGSSERWMSSGGRYVPKPIGPPPTVEAGPDEILECGGPEGTRVVLIGTGSGCEGSTGLKFTWSGPGGGQVQGTTAQVTLPLGTSVINLTIEDGLGQSAEDSVSVTVRDTTPPLLICPSVAPTECSSSEGTPLIVPLAHATDLCDTNPVVVNSHGPGGADASGTYPLGSTDVEMRAIDASGNQTGCSFPVNVRDTTPPEITVTPSPSVLWPPNHRMVDVAVAMTATDACSTPLVVLESITSSEPDDLAGSNDGNTSGDIQGASPGTADFDFQLRAERDGAGEGRFYTVSYSAVDGSGNRTNASSIVLVPHDQGGSTEPITLSARDEMDGFGLSWEPVPRATSYKMIRGTTGAIRDAGSFIDLGNASCILADSADTISTVRRDRQVPPIGQAFFYLVSYNDGAESGYGSDTASKPRLKTAGGCN